MTISRRSDWDYKDSDKRGPTYNFKAMKKKNHSSTRPCSVSRCWGHFFFLKRLMILKKINLLRIYKFATLFE